MATRNTGLNSCPDCAEYKEDCTCGTCDDWEDGFDDAWIDDQEGWEDD